MTKEQKLNKHLQEQEETIAKLSGRLNTMADRIVVLENDIVRFKKNVANDIKKIVSGGKR